MDRIFEENSKTRKVLVLGHRGCSERYPENTMESFRACAANPMIDGVELDVHLCSTGEVVISHDSLIKRTSGLDVVIEETPWERLSQIDVGSFKDKSFSSCRIPLLEQLFSEIGNRFYYDIEIKVPKGSDYKTLCRKTLDLIDKYGLRDHVMVSSFFPFAVRYFNRICREIPGADIYCVAKDVPKICQNGMGHIASHSTFTKPQFDQVDEEFFKSHWNLPVITWTVNSKTEAERLLSYNMDNMKVFGLIGNDPDMLANVCSEKGFCPNN